jgi:GNAT superfamily N-acetyltransferase
VARTIFRRIGGRIIPIRIGSTKVGQAMGYAKQREITAKVGGKTIGSLSAGVPIRGIKKTLKAMDLDVDREFQKKGIGTALFQHLTELAKRAGYTRIKGTQLVSENAAKIRNKFDTDFFRFYQPGNTTKKISFEKAIKSIRKRKDVRAVTKLKGRK